MQSSTGNSWIDVILDNGASTAIKNAQDVYPTKTTCGYGEGFAKEVDGLADRKRETKKGRDKSRPDSIHSEAYFPGPNGFIIKINFGKIVSEPTIAINIANAVSTPK